MIFWEGYVRLSAVTAVRWVRKRSLLGWGYMRLSALLLPQGVKALP